MRTVVLELSMNHVAITFPDEVVQGFRNEAQHNPTPFLKSAHELHPEDDEAFMTLILSNGVRAKVSEAIQQLCAESKFGLRLSPAKVNRTVADVQKQAARESERTQNVPV